MLFIVGVVFVLFIIILVKYCDCKGKDSGNYKLDMYGNMFLEVVWIVILILIVIVFFVFIVQMIYLLEKVFEVIKDKEFFVVYVILVDWKWVFSYLEQDIEMVNYLNIFVDCLVLFKIFLVDLMVLLWIFQFGG